MGQHGMPMHISLEHGVEKIHIKLDNYLAGTARPDILFAVHQCANYSIDTKQSHEESVKRIVRYLKKTKDKGLVFTP